MEELARSGIEYDQRLIMKDWSSLSIEDLVNFYKVQKGSISLDSLKEFIKATGLENEAAFLIYMGKHLKMATQDFQLMERMIRIGEPNIIRHKILKDISDEVAASSKAAIIQAIGIDKLCNKIKGSVCIKQEHKDFWTKDRLKRWAIDHLFHAKETVKPLRG